jgi:UDP-glucose 4-epimerase
LSGNKEITILKKVIVTGGTGYIGSHVVVDLVNKGYEPIIIDNLSNSERSVLDGIKKITGTEVEFAEIDLRNKVETLDFFKKHNDSVGVIHFAALKAVGESVEHPLKYYNNNLDSLINVLQGMGDNNISNLIFSSSCTVYGEPDALPVNELSPIKKPTSPYGHTKQMGEEIIQNYINSTTQKKAISLRYFNPIGAHESAHIGELPKGIPSNLMPYITQTAIGLRECLSVFGDDYNTHDGTAIRDYIHVCDLADAHIVALEKLLADNNQEHYQVYNLGLGKGYSVLDVIKSFESSTSQKLNYKIAARRAGDVSAIYADNTKATTELNWKANYSLDDMTSSAWKWQLKLNKS